MFKKNAAYMLVLLVIVASLVLAACGPTPEPTKVPEPTQAAAEPEPTKAPEPTEPPPPAEKKIATFIWTQEFDNLNPIIWHKIANASYEVENGSKFLGKPYEPNAIIKNDIEFILMQRKPGGYRKPTPEQRKRSMIEKSDYNEWFQQIWTIPGASTKNHPAPFPRSNIDSFHVSSMGSWQNRHS